ncbi:hypothetical protein HB839_15065, partial [Listeria sp. FSL L7-1699]|nr:hypothetical protein [Listeria farberi]
MSATDKDGNPVDINHIKVEGT